MISTGKSRGGVSRRRAMGVGALGVGAAVAGRALAAPARVNAAPADYRDHAFTGTWLAMANPTLAGDPQFPGVASFQADGTVITQLQPSQRDESGGYFSTGMMGVWAPEDDLTIHFTAVQVHSDIDGVLIGSLTLDTYPVLSADGSSFSDDGSRTTLTIRDATGAVVMDFMPGPSPVPVIAYRMTPGNAGFPPAPEGTPTA